jgi:hypothetical protein
MKQAWRKLAKGAKLGRTTGSRRWSNGERGTMMKNRLPWESMRVTYLGNVAEIVQQGGGKITTLTGDPGEPRKVPPTG